MPATQNHTVPLNDDFTFEMAFYEDDDTTPRDISLSSFAFTVKPVVDLDPTDAAAYIAVDTASMTIDEDTEVAGGGVNNRVSFRVARSVILAIPPGTYPCDFRELNAAGDVLTLTTGDFVVPNHAGLRVPS